MWLVVLLVIAKILLAILMVLLLLLLYLLVAPFRYKISFVNKDEMRLRADLSSLLRFFRLTYENQQTPAFQMYLLWRFPIFSETAESKEDVSGDSISENMKNEDHRDTVERMSGSNKRVNKSTGDEENRQNSSSISSYKKEHKYEHKNGQKKERKSHRKRFSFEESDKLGIAIVVKNVLRLLRHFLPRKIKADFSFSMGEPDVTGYILAGISCIPFRNAQIKRIEPDFESEDPYFNGRISLHGSIQLIFVLIALLRIVVHKECRRLLRFI